MRTSAPIFRYNEQREQIVREVVDRVVKATKDPTFVLSDAIYHEVRRHTSSGHPEEATASWRSLARRLSGMVEAEKLEEIRKLATTYGWDIAGNFDKRVFDVATRLIPPLLGGLLAPRKTFTSLHRLLDAGALSESIAVEGNINAVRSLIAHGTVIYVPTHLSNMDSIVFGYALDRAGLPPATYGAGKNLFTNPVLSYFMHNLGAYRVDRRLRHKLYKDVLKTYSTVILERGFHSLFFPGGTRSRSGGVERHLKLGLAGTGLEAFTRSAMANPAHPQRIFFVPATISYLVTLEAETLISDFLKESGKNRFIIEDDESTRLAKVAGFAEKLARHEGGVVVRFGDPLDPFGNPVDEMGQSIDGAGHVVDPVSYLRNRKGEIVLDTARDIQYTRELGEVICESFLSNTVVLPTHVVAACVMNRLRQTAKTDDVFTLLRIRHKAAVTRQELYQDVETMRKKLVDMESQGKIIIGQHLRKDPVAIVEEALKAFGGTHSAPVLEEHVDGLAMSDGPLVFYYQNRLAGHGLALDVLVPEHQRKRSAA
jgi:glycerol-3-phosphate O-acyltransferase